MQSGRRNVSPILFSNLGKISSEGSNINEVVNDVFDYMALYESESNNDALIPNVPLPRSLS